MTQQQVAGLTAISDGQLRRPDSCAALAAAIEGIVHNPTLITAEDGSGLAGGYAVTGPLRPRARLVAGEIELLHRLAPQSFKIGLPAPGSLACAMFRGAKITSPYASIRDLAAAFAPIVRQEFEALAASAVPYLQLSSPAYTALLEPGYRSRMEAMGEDPDSLLRDLIAVDAAALEGLQRPGGTTTALRVGIKGRSLQPPGRHAAMLEQVLATVPADRFLIEFRGLSAEEFGPLRALPRGKMAVLGLIDNQGASLADIDGVLDQIDLAVQFSDAANLAISPQRGFGAPGIAGTTAALARQRTVLEVTGEVARRYWGIEL
ncbi:MAG: hypothetical protein KGJ52_08530 [Gammaproteobacteria bacterium]|nr:hypothetical protein [Gammaproteobacteria bacterium]